VSNGTPRAALIPDQNRRRVVHTFARVALSVVLIGLAVLAVDRPKRAEPHIAAIVLICLVLLLLVWILDPADLRDRIKNIRELSVGSFKIVMDSAENAAATAPSDEDRDTDSKADSMFELRMLLEAKLAYIAKYLFADEDNPTLTYVTIGSLRYDRLLTESQALTADAVLTIRDEELAGLKAEERAKLLHDANQVVTSIRLVVFRSLVKQQLVKGGWSVAEEGSALHGQKDGRELIVRPTLQLAKPGKVRSHAPNRIVVVPSIMLRTRRMDRDDVVAYSSLLEIAEGRAL
jgi:hypothetical protein